MLEELVSPEPLRVKLVSAAVLSVEPVLVLPARLLLGPDSPLLERVEPVSLERLRTRLSLPEPPLVELTLPVRLLVSPERLLIELVLLACVLVELVSPLCVRIEPDSLERLRRV